MTDYDIFKNMLTRAGVVFEEFIEKDDKIAITITAVYGWNTPNRGYQGFYTSFTFKPDGSLMCVTVAE